MTSAPDDWELANRADPQAMDLLFRRHRDYVYRILWMALGRTSVAEDLAQEVFLRIANRQRPGRRPLFRGAAFRTWLYRVAVNLARDHQRRASRERPLEAETGSVTGPCDPRDVSEQPDLKQLREALQQLPTRQREVILLRELEGFSTAETASALGISAGSVKTHRHRAMQQLKIEFNPETNPDHED
ncbi:MAG: RNA polymerase sigma factor [Pseudomonadota bacterium]